MDLNMAIKIAIEKCGFKEGSSQLNWVIGAWQEAERQKLPQDPKE
jgi:hypothetical protein